MISSSPEYAITKPGMPPHMLRKREKSLRTYGRKPASTPEPRGEPSAKKARFEPGSLPQSTKPSKPATIDSRSERDSAPLPSTEEASRSSILKYFRPLPAETKPRSVDKGAKIASLPSTDTMLLVRTRRKPRLLRFQGTSLPSDISSEDAFSLSGRDEDETDGNPSSPDKKRKSLRDGADNLLNQTRRDGTCPDGRMKDRRLRSKRSPTVQTTLNISSQAAFAECKVCDTVWNPLHPPDVKYHDKRHKAVLRLKRKREEDEL